MSLLDVAPTILSLAGVPRSEKMIGGNLLTLIDGGPELAAPILPQLLAIKNRPPEQNQPEIDPEVTERPWAMGYLE